MEMNMTEDVNVIPAAQPGDAKPRAVKSRGGGMARQTKKQQLIRMLSAKAGADITSLSQKLGWLPHTTRAALSGLKKAGHLIAVEKGAEGKPSRYRILPAPEASEAQ
jgi:hypothetical protein